MRILERIHTQSPTPFVYAATLHNSLNAMTLLQNAVLFLCLLATVRSGHDTEAICSWEDFELPAPGEWVEPVLYDIHLDVHMREPWTVTGESAVDVIVRQPTDCIVINSVGIDIEEAKAKGFGSADLSYNEELQQVTLEFDKPLTAGNHTLLFQFRYAIEKGLDGFYRSTYVQDGEDKIIAVTQFEPMGARKAFPSFDEPNIRSNFDISITTGSEYTVLSNMPPAEVKKSNGRKTWVFERTPPMPTYLIAFLVGELGTKTTTIPPYDAQDGVIETPNYWYGGQGPRTLSVSGNPEQEEDTVFALESAARVLLALEDSFKMAYALPHMQMVGVSDFSAGAMENWGLLMYRGDLILASDTTSYLTKQAISTTVAHEIVHQWFGNLVTIDWWSSLWVKESLTTLFEFLAGDAANPEQDVMVDFQANVLRGSFDEGLEDPIAHSRDDTQSLDDIDAIYTTVTYEKGASILYMLRQWVDRNESSKILNPMFDSSSQFMDTVRAYLYNFSYDSVSSEQLVDFWGESLGMDVHGMLQSWLYEPGYPVVLIDRDPETGDVRLEQRRMLDNHTFADACDENKLWWIPVAFRTSMAPEEVQWTEFDTCQSTVPIARLPDDAWIDVNTGSFGHYRVVYDSNLTAKLIEAVAVPGALSDIDVVSLQEDLAALPGDGRIDAFIQLIEAIQSRSLTDRLSYQGALRSMVSLARRLNCSEDLGRYSTKFIYEPMLESPVPGYPNLLGRDVLGVGELSEEFPTSILTLKAEVLGLIGYLERAPVSTAEFQEYFDQILDETPENDLDVSSYFYIMSQVLRNGSQQALDKAVETSRTTNDASLKKEILKAIPFFPNQTKVLELAFSPSIRGQDALSLIRNTAKNPSSGLRCTEWVAENFEQLFNKIGPYLGSGLASACVKYVTDERAIKTLENIVEVSPESVEDVESAIAKVQSNRASVELFQDVCQIVSENLTR